MKNEFPEVSRQKPEVSRAPSRGLQTSRLKLETARRGMALIITLILLSVTLVMVVAFLAVSRRERASVTTTTDTTIARLAADTALAAAQSQIIANLRTTNASLLHATLLVSTNYINPVGYMIGSQSPTNVNYDFRNVDGLPLNGADYEQNVANLQFLPRVPVLVNSSTRPDGTNQGRFFLDLNRNGLFEDTGSRVADVDGTGFTNGFIIANGDPQWVGILERPGQTHAADNKFLSRYAFFAQPISDSLDLNYLHNESMTRTVKNSPTASGVNEGYLRNQSIGSWELNLAAFLADLNTNQWNNPLTQPYQFFEPGSFNRGFAFEDALSLLSYRYDFNYNNLASLFQSLGNGNAGYLSVDQNDILTDGPLQTTTTNIDELLPGNADQLNVNWAGANNPNQFYRPGDLFDPTKSSGGVTGGFTNRLLNAGNGVSTYDRYTFYRMLEQLGTDSTPANEGKLNLNYSNAVVRYDANGAFLSATVIPGAETNLVPWNPRDFFCAAADALLKHYTTNWFQSNPTNYLATYYGITGNAANFYYTDFNGNVVWTNSTGYGLTNVPVFGITNQIPAFGLSNIPVLVNGQLVYAPAVNRLLQLAANLYDASTNDFFPHVFRPIFYRENFGTRDVYIVGYEEQESVPAGVNDPALAQPINVNRLANGVHSSTAPNPMVNVYGLPWIIGAKKGLPNFNQFIMRNDVQLTRKLQVGRTSYVSHTASPGSYYTNVMYLMAITNRIGFSFWNSYTTNYVSPNNQPITVAARNSTEMWLTNAVRVWYQTNGVFYLPGSVTSWPGSQWDPSIQPPANRQASNFSFKGQTYDFPFLSESAYVASTANFVPTWANPNFETNISPTLYSLPKFGLVTSNGFQAYILDGNKVIDYVHFNGPSGVRDLNDEIRDKYNGPNVAPYRMWLTNAPGNVPAAGVDQGLINQIIVSKTGPSAAPAGGRWIAPSFMPPGLTQTPQMEAEFFKGFFTPTYKWVSAGKTYSNTVLIVQAPYTPMRTVAEYTVWQANDPLVHYLDTDLSVIDGNSRFKTSDGASTQPLPGFPLGQVGERYQPWGRNSQMAGIVGVDQSAYNLAFKDPLVAGSDDWNFPTNKYPSLGWLGRVHRGTPWQSVYLKATNILEYVDTAQANPLVGINTWATWSGNQTAFEAANSRPVADNRLFDIFTAAPNANAARGLLSVNQTHLAAWSAVLSGLVVPTNQIGGYTVIDPAGVDTVNSYLAQIVNGTNGINLLRTNTALFPNGQFTKIGDILRAPILSEQSPYLFGLDSQTEISDAMYEWLPQQMLGLLRGPSAPRFVVYAYGQTLKPAPDGTVLGSGLVTNYQVVAESATRAIITVTPQVVMTNAFGPVTNYSTRVENFNALPPE